MKPASDAALSIRVPLEYLRRADALIPMIATEGLARGQTHASRSLVIKQAIDEGLKVMEARAARKSR
jgi:hypothetical protein